MRYLFFITASFFSLTFFSCRFNSGTTEKKISDRIPVLIGEDENLEDEQDGIREAQQMEFEYTKDISLGYIPKYRLINAMEALKSARANGSYPQRLNALTWSERGSNSDAVGPSNGNGRVSGTQVTSGRMRAIWVDLADATNHTVWVGGVDGGIWKTTDVTASPATWTLANDFLGNLAIADITQDPTNTNTMYFATGERAVNSDAVVGGGVWKSVDHGVTWSLLAGTTSFWNASRIVCDAAGNVYVAAVASLTGVPGSTGGIYRSTDGGATWSANISPTGLSARVTEMVISSTGRMHIACGYYNTAVGSAGYRYTDAPSTVTSGTWVSPTTSFSPVQYNVDIAAAGSTLYALPSSSSFQTSQVWKSTDGGDNWAITTTTPPTTGSTPLSSGQAWYNLAIAVDPTDANNVMVGGLNSYRSIDGGATWSVNSVWVTGVPGSSNYIHADHHIIVWNNNQVLDGGDGGIFYSADDGATWADRNVGLRLKQFYACAIHPTSTNYFLAGAQDNGVHQLNGAGITSSVEVTGGDGAFVHIDEDEPQYQFGSYVFNVYRRSTNSGATWGTVSYSSSIGQFINPTDYDDINNNFYGPWSAGSYIRWMSAPTTTNAFSVSVSSMTTSSLTATTVSKYTSNRVFFGSSNGKIIRADNAHTGTPTLTDITGSGMSASTVSCIAQGTTANNLIATFSNYGAAHVWVSTTGGGAAAWTNITGNLPDIPVRWAMFYPEDNTQAIIATEMGIFETSLINGGSTVWVQNSTFPTVKTNMLQYRFSDNALLAASHGRGLWTSSITPVSPYVRFASSYTYSSVKNEATGSTTGCRNYTDYTLNMHIDKAPTGTANVTLSIAGGATATQGVDFDFTTNGSFVSPSNVVTFPSGGTADQPITIRVYNDAEVEAGTEFFTFNYSIGGGTDAVAAPSSNSYTFYIGENDITPTSTAVETVLNNNITEHVPNNGTYYFYSTGVNRLINSLTGTSGNLGCVTSNVFEAGSTWQSFAGGERSQKVIEVTPTTNTGSSYTIGLYYTAAELAGKPPASLKIAKTTAATMASANALNTTVVSTSFASYNGSDYVFTASFTGFSKYFLVDNNVVLPVDLISFSGYLNNQQKSVLQWKTTNQFNLEKFEVQRSYDGVQFATIGNVDAVPNPPTVQDYGYTEPTIAKAVNFYRLRMVDFDGKEKLSAIIKITNNKPVKFVELLENPVRNNISFIIDNSLGDNVSMLLYSNSGQLINRWNLGNQQGTVLVPIDRFNLSSGIYILRIGAGNRSESFRISKQ
ncbi:MAG TPA: T9SS type A sorting domain-containing protein [Chitinophagaceae bacterium]|nr:T9SS type A sorting domain-containing protein [Chitinophagaceae bacterium]